MLNPKYANKVKLLIKCLPSIASEECFAIKGGTAINLFCLDLPRLSVDIDLVYLPIEGREETYQNIHKALDRITQKLKKIGLTVQSNGKAERKLVCSDGIADIKIEPNYNLRGYIYQPRNMEICEKAQDLFGYAEAQIISEAELWGGKICAALDRQHPRDLFDIHNLLNEKGITTDIKNGFIALLLSGNRPIHEILNPNFQMKEETFRSEFEGMTEESFDFEEAKATFHHLVENIITVLSDEDKQSLLNFVQLKIDLENSYIPNLNELPAIKWKLQNLKNLRDSNLEKFKDQYNKLKMIL